MTNGAAPCPRCDADGWQGDVVLYPQRDRHSGTKAYTARCQLCGFAIDGLGSDGTRAKALDEWQALCDHAMQVKKHILGATKMGKQLELNISNVTQWFDAAESQPGLSGWYNVRFKMSDEEREARNPPLQRRWWDGQDVCFSRPVYVGEEMSQERMEEIKLKPSTFLLNDLEWQGLQEPHPEMYGEEEAALAKAGAKRVKIAGFTF
jgi:hypothetical protein